MGSGGVLCVLVDGVVERLSDLIAALSYLNKGDGHL